MKTEIKYDQLQYPALKIHISTKIVVLFINPKRGFVVFSHIDSGYPIGDFSSNLTESDFEIFNGSVTLSN